MLVASSILTGIKLEQEKRIEFLNSVIETLTQARDELKASVSKLEEGETLCSNAYNVYSEGIDTQDYDSTPPRACGAVSTQVIDTCRDSERKR